MTCHLEVAKDVQEAFVLCLTLGTLEAMRRGALSLEAGIWTLGRPVFWQPLQGAGLDPAIVSVLQTVDELSALESLCGRCAADEALDRMIATVRARLSASPNRFWYARWSTKG